MQLFCGVLIDPQNPIKNGKIVSAIRNRLARCVNIKELQAILYDKWPPKLANKDLCLTDATCYECHLRYPRDVKLLWESSAWLHTLLSKNLEKENRETNVTCFARKGPKPKDEDADLHTTKRIIGYLRATVMEGSFGNQKLHYGVGRIVARNQFCETLLLFFGIHMANAATLAARELAKEEALKKRNTA